MQPTIFKFGGASVGSASGVRNTATILESQKGAPVVVVISAMGKTTNALEAILSAYIGSDAPALVEAFDRLRRFHFDIVDELFPASDTAVRDTLDSLFNMLRGYIRKGHLYEPGAKQFDFEYDQVVSFGELFSSAILFHYLEKEGFRCRLFDARELILTDSLHRDARVNWELTGTRIREALNGWFAAEETAGGIAVTQGFIGCTPEGHTTTLGREGSDFSAAIFAWSLKAREMTIWKDVPGVMTADPRWMDDARVMETLSYREAIELAYYGASVIHPKTIKPLENAGITLRVRSFANPALSGTVVKKLQNWTIPYPIYIRKQNQVLISVSPRDFSFILEENLSQIFRILADFRIRVNVMQNSAISFSFCVDADPQKVLPLIEFLKRDYETRYNEGLELFTIRHYNEDAVRRLSEGRKLLMELRSRNTVQLVCRPATG